jgi:hypothetical protein
MEYALVFGLAIPAMLPMLVIVLAVQCAVLHFAKEHFLLRVIHIHRPPLGYLGFSVCLGYALLAWFFVDNDLHGKGLAVLGPPMLVLYVLLYEKLKRKMASWSSATAQTPSDLSQRRDGSAVRPGCHGAEPDSVCLVGSCETMGA